MAVQLGIPREVPIPEKSRYNDLCKVLGFTLTAVFLATIGALSCAMNANLGGYMSRFENFRRAIQQLGQFTHRIVVSVFIVVSSLVVLVGINLYFTRVEGRKVIKNYSLEHANLAIYPGTFIRSESDEQSEDKIAAHVGANKEFLLPGQCGFFYVHQRDEGFTLYNMFPLQYDNAVLPAGNVKLYLFNCDANVATKQNIFCLGTASANAITAATTLNAIVDRFALAETEICTMGKKTVWITPIHSLISQFRS